MDNEKTIEAVTKDSVEWALAHGVGFKSGLFSSMHTPFTLTPTPITRERFTNLKSKAGLLGRLLHHASEDHDFLANAIGPVTAGDEFFRQLWTTHQTIKDSTRRLPLLIMRSDFMDDAKIGPKLIEFNGIAAGMGPFGQRIHELHEHVKTQWPETYQAYAATDIADTELVENSAIEELSHGIAKATLQIKQEFGDRGPARFLMVVQADEDNVYDQHLLEYALQKQGIQTIRRSLRELHDALSTGNDHRLIMDGVGTIDTVYLRSGYLHCDYYAPDLDCWYACCTSLMNLRMFIEQHRIAMNATVNQQMASSKRVQTLLSSMDATELTRFGLTLDEAHAVKELLGENYPVTSQSLEWIRSNNPEDWVLKNQGEGGGHAVFGKDIADKLQQLTPQDLGAWSLMRRLRPSPREVPTLLVRKGDPTQCADLISEIGVFTVHVNGIPATKDQQGYAGYLIRSKPAETTEGGVHSGMGVLDSLVYAN